MLPRSHRRHGAPGLLPLLLVSCAVVGCTEAKPPPGAPEGSGETGLFTEVSRASGIEFRFESGARGEHFLIETMAGGLGWIDYDADGDYDLYVTNGHENPRGAPEPGRATNILYENDGDGNFRDVTRRAGVGDSRYSNGVAVADYDGDGRSDLLVLNYGRNTLYRNRGDGTFEEVTEAAGLIHEGYGVSAVWFDLDNDGDLDLYVVRYLDYSTSESHRCIEGKTRVYCHPRFFAGQPDLLYENLSNGRFREIGGRAGINRSGGNEGKGLGVIATDIDRDGRVDIYVANDTTPNFLWRNRGDGTFEDIAFRLGLAVDENGKPQAGMGVDWADVNGDGLFDIHVTNFSQETNSLYLGLPGGGYFDGVQRAGLGHSYTRLGFGTLLADLDKDGDVDIFVVNGHVDDEVESSLGERGLRYRQSPDLYLNEGGGRFRLSREQGGPICSERFVGRGLASSDFDGDGDVDLAIATLDRGVLLLRNNAPEDRHHLTVRLRGARRNTDAYGARVEVKFGGERRVFEYQSARSYLSAIDPRIFLGLGEVRQVDELTVHWPGGKVQTLERIQSDREIILTEPE